MEKRKKNAFSTKPGALPADFTKMVADVLTANFDSGIKALTAVAGAPAHFSVLGELYPDEVLLGLVIQIEGQLAATTVRASADFDPRANSPTVQDLLSACVDAAGSLLGQLLDPKNKARLEQLASESLGAMDNVPFVWTPVVLDRYKIHLLVDKTNPKLDKLADEWLDKHDPDRAAREAQEHAETEKLFVTGKEPRNRPKGH